MCIYNSRKCLTTLNWYSDMQISKTYYVNVFVCLKFESQSNINYTLYGLQETELQETVLEFWEK